MITFTVEVSIDSINHISRNDNQKCTERSGYMQKQNLEEPHH